MNIFETMILKSFIKILKSSVIWWPRSIHLVRSKIKCTQTCLSKKMMSFISDNFPEANISDPDNISLSEQYTGNSCLFSLFSHIAVLPILPS